jgi:hypothetical protein
MKYVDELTVLGELQLLVFLLTSRPYCESIWLNAITAWQCSIEVCHIEFQENL